MDSMQTGTGAASASVQEQVLEVQSAGTDTVDAMAQVKRLLRLGFPIVASCLLQNLISMVSIMVVGHLGEVHLAGAALATSLASVTGYYVLGCRHGHGVGHVVRAGVRGPAVPPPVHLQAARHGAARARLHPDRHRLGQRQAHPSAARSGPCHRDGCRRVRAVAHPVTRVAGAVAVPRTFPEGAEPRPARHGQLRCRRALPRSRVLGPGVQVRHGHQRRRAQQRCLLRCQRGLAGAVREAIQQLQGHVDWVLHRGVQGATPVRQARPAVGHDDLVASCIARKSRLSSWVGLSVAR